MIKKQLSKKKLPIDLLKYTSLGLLCTAGALVFTNSTVAIFAFSAGAIYFLIPVLIILFQYFRS